MNINEIISRLKLVENIKKAPILTGELDEDLAAYEDVIATHGVNSEQEWHFYDEMQRKYSGKVTTKGTKIGRLFYQLRDFKEQLRERQSSQQDYL